VLKKAGHLTLLYNDRIQFANSYYFFNIIFNIIPPP